MNEEQVDRLINVLEKIESRLEQIDITLYESDLHSISKQLENLWETIGSK